MSAALDLDQLGKKVEPPTDDDNVECGSCKTIYEAGEWRAWIVGRQRIAADPAFCDCNRMPGDPHWERCDSVARTLILWTCPKCGSTRAVREEG